MSDPLPKDEVYECYETPTPVCPHCGHVFNIDEMLAQSDDVFAIAPGEDTICIDCPICDKNFAVRGGYHPHYTSAFTEDELDFI